MTDAAVDDELDDILDGALEEFEKTAESSLAPHTEGTTVAADNATELSSSEETEKREQTHKADRALEEALNSLAKPGLSADGKGLDEGVIEEDLKLVEEFIRGLASTLGTTDTPPGNGAGPSAPESSADNGDSRQTAERFVESIVGSLLSEDVLKRPMAEMSTAYEKWLEENTGKLSEEELVRYRKQHELIKEICDKYNAKADSSEVMELLSKVHSTGDPPPEVIKSLDADGDDALPKDQAAELDKLADQCGVQ